MRARDEIVTPVLQISDKAQLHAPEQSHIFRVRSVIAVKPAEEMRLRGRLHPASESFTDNASRR
jgi:hypothetical protein